MTENETTTVTDTTQMSTEYDATNVKEFTKAKIVMMNKVVMYKKKMTFTNKQTDKEETKDNAYLFIEINDRVMPTRANKYTIDALNVSFKTTNPAKWVNKTIVATVHEFNKQKYLVWKAEETIN